MKYKMMFTALFLAIACAATGCVTDNEFDASDDLEIGALETRESAATSVAASLTFLRAQPHAACGLSQPNFQLSVSARSTQRPSIAPARGLGRPTIGSIGSVPAAPPGSYTLLLTGGLNTVFVDVTPEINQALATGAPVTITRRVPVYPGPCGTVGGPPAIVPIPIVGTLVGPGGNRLATINFSV